MDLRTEGLDKMLESLGPALSEDIARILESTRRQLEEEFRKRLEAVVRDTEKAAASVTDSQREEILTKAREQLSLELKAQYDQTLRKTTAEMQAEFDHRLRVSEQQSQAERTRLQEQVNLWRTYAEAQRKMAESRSQAEVLSHFLDRVEAFAPSIAVYVAKTDGLGLWKTRGRGAFPPVVSQSTIDPDAYFKPIVIRDKTVAAVCARPPFRAESLDFLSACLAYAIETFGMRLQNRNHSAASAGSAP
jgi:hypothetical protein